MKKARTSTLPFLLAVLACAACGGETKSEPPGLDAAAPAAVDTPMASAETVETSDTAAGDAGGEDAVTAWGIRLSLPGAGRDANLCGADGARCAEAARATWDELCAAADEAYDRGEDCGFVAFVGYEYTDSTAVTNRHRNVLFRNGAVPALPPSFFEQAGPWNLWSALDAACAAAGPSCETLVVPHNANWSNGHLFAPEYGGATGQAEERDAATFRGRLEPLVEVVQHKGDGECKNGYAGVEGETDPLCDFEKIRAATFEDCGDGTGGGGIQGLGCLSWRDFARGVFLSGLQEQRRLGVNPYRLGVIGSTDTHNGTPGLTREHDFPGHVGVVDDTPHKRLGEGTVTHGALQYNPGGLAGVWAEERSRDALFDAFQRRETFATSGTRIEVRLFAGWDYPDGP